MSESKNTKRLVEKYFENMHVQHRAEMDRRIVQDSTEAMEGVRRTRANSARAGIGRTMMMHRTRRVAAIIAVAVVLAGVIGLGEGSVAFSRVGHAVSSTLTRLKELIMEIRTGEPAAQAPLPPGASGDADEQVPAPNVRAITCAARFFNIPASEQAVWQSLKDQGIELIQASAAPETYYATLRQEQAEQVEAILTIRPLAAPRVIVADGQQGMIAMDIFALAWLPTISSDGMRIESSFSFHDGQTGFEIPNVSIEEGGVILVRVKGIVPTGEDILILLRVSRTQ
jgi:hypothetical protein